ncbi:hypothetical protein predicted by Glimmer/Critica [Bartonella tribocorum CIP 105476]|uniref:Uncharacterized protein n=1 Tax=Bartonella tribocorum (strain DSM 28219 / CCUG 45778 / CIP 105476 / IBS 506) TaxID=382640 RepID=A9IYJ2_BART1|nr:hypothetical protein predicted by Glimmer/Critica [Bartonella tribocorum CIP 105476]
MATGWHSVLRERCSSIKERDKQKREAISNLHYWNKILLWVLLKAVKLN